MGQIIIKTFRAKLLSAANIVLTLMTYEVWRANRVDPDQEQSDRGNPVCSYLY